MKKLLVLFFLVFSNIFILSIRISAQFQSGNYSGNDAASYQCFDADGKVLLDPLTGNTTPLIPTGPDAQGNFYCNVGGTRYNGYLKPPALQQLEVWFVRVLYAVWALVASLSFLLIVKLGYEYMISRGAPEAMVKVKDRIVKYAFGFALVFLAVPVLTTVFRFLGINQDVDCYNVNMPGFQFFYVNLCTDPRDNISEIADPCDIEDRLGTVCDPLLVDDAIPLTCSTGTTSCTLYYCRDTEKIWTKSEVTNLSCNQVLQSI